MLERTTEHRLDKNKNQRAVELPGTHRVLTAPVGGTRDMSQSEHLEQLDITEQQAGRGAMTSPASPGTKLDKPLGVTIRGVTPTLYCPWISLDFPGL